MGHRLRAANSRYRGRHLPGAWQVQEQSICLAMQVLGESVLLYIAVLHRHQLAQAMPAWRDQLTGCLCAGRRHTLQVLLAPQLFAVETYLLSHALRFRAQCPNPKPPGLSDRNRAV